MAQPQAVRPGRRADRVEGFVLPVHRAVAVQVAPDVGVVRVQIAQRTVQQEAIGQRHGPVEFDAEQIQVRGVERVLHRGAGRAARQHHALQILDHVEEYRAVEPRPRTECVLEAQLEVVHLLLIGRPRIGALGRDAHVVVARPESPRPMPVHQRVLRGPPRQADLGRKTVPAFVVREIARAARAAHHVAAGVGRIRPPVALHVGHVRFLLLVGVAQAGGQRQPVGQVVVPAHEQPQRVHVVVTAAELAVRRELLPLVVVEGVGEVIDAGGQAQPVEEHAGVAQFVAELLGLLPRPQVVRELGHRRAVEVAQRVAARGAPAEDVRQRAVPERHVPIQPRVEEMHLRVEKAVLVHEERVIPAVVIARVLTGRPVGVDALVFVAQRQVHGLGHAPVHDRAQHQRVLCAERPPVAPVLEPALVLIGIHREARRHPLGQWRVERGGREEVGRLAAALHRTAHGRLVPVGRGFGVEQDGAADHVAAEQHALRPAQHFDAVQVEGVVQHDRARAHVDPIDEHADRRVDGRYGTVHAHAADGEIRGAARGADLVEAHVGNADGEIAQVAQLRRGELLGVEGGDGQRHVLNTLLAFLRGHDDGVQQRGVVCGRGLHIGRGQRLLRRGRHSGQRQHRAQREQAAGGTAERESSVDGGHRLLLLIRLECYGPGPFSPGSRPGQALTLPPLPELVEGSKGRERGQKEKAGHMNDPRTSPARLYFKSSQ